MTTIERFEMKRKRPMNRYVFFTGDGYAEDLEGEPIENLQILGFALGEAPEAAFEALKTECSYLKSFSYNVVKAYRIVGEVTTWDLTSSGGLSRLIK